MLTSRFFLAAAAAALAFIATAQAKPTLAQAGEPAYITGYIGYFDVSQQDDTATQVGMEYRAQSWVYGIRPTIGINVTSDSAAYVYGGFNWDVPLINKQLYLIPNVVVGAYHSGSGKDLGGAIEFRSGIELAYQFENQQRLGVAFNHISNASIYNHNPGGETVLVNYSVPLK